MTHATPSARGLRERDSARMLNAPHNRNRHVMDHSHRVAVVREVPRPATALAW